MALSDGFLYYTYTNVVSDDLTDSPFSQEHARLQMKYVDSLDPRGWRTWSYIQRNIHLLLASNVL